jgi:hypothetical protein
MLARRQGARDNFSVPETERTLTTAELREALQAECKLAELDLYEDLAALHDEETCPVLRRYFAERYATILGVQPDRREELRSALEPIRDGSGASVAALLADLRRDYPRNGSGPAAPDTGCTRGGD